MIYYIVYFILATLCVVTPLVKKSQKNWPMYTGAFLIFFFQALRWKTGTDWNPYYEEFINVNNPLWDDKFELGYRILNSFVRHITDKYTFFLLLECGLNTVFIVFFIKKMAVSNPCIVLLYLFVISLFPIRYTLASNLILCSYYFIEKKRLIHFLVIIFIAFLIHRTSIIFLPFYFICQHKISFKLLIYIYISSIILGVLAEYTFGNLLQIASLMYGFADSTVQGKMMVYVSGDIPDRLKMTPLRFLISTINSTFFILFFYYFKRRFFNRDRKYDIMFTLYVLGISFNRIFLQTIPDMARLTSLFTGGFIIMLVMIISSLKKSYQTIATIGIIAYLFVTYYTSINGFYKDLYIPYYTVFENPIRNMY